MRSFQRLENDLYAAAEPWLQLVEHVERLGARLEQLFAQLVSLFDGNRALAQTLLEQFDRQRMRRYAEGFFLRRRHGQIAFAPVAIVVESKWSTF